MEKSLSDLDIDLDSKLEEVQVLARLSVNQIRSLATKSKLPSVWTLNGTEFAEHIVGVKSGSGNWRLSLLFTISLAKRMHRI